MRGRIRRFIENDAELLALDFLLSRAEDGSTLCTTPIGFTHFVCTAVSRSEIFSLLCSSHELLIVLTPLASRCSALPEKKKFSTMTSADSCRLNLASLPGLL